MPAGGTSLKELQLSSAAWWFFWCTLRAGPENGQFPWFRTVKSLKILFVASVVVTVFLSRRLAAVLFSAAAPLHIPSWIRLLYQQSFKLVWLDTEYSIATVPPASRPSQSDRRSTARVESKCHLRLALRGGDLLANAARDRCNYTVTLILFSCCCFGNLYHYQPPSRRRPSRLGATRGMGCGAVPSGAGPQPDWPTTATHCQGTLICCVHASVCSPFLFINHPPITLPYYVATEAGRQTHTVLRI